MSVYLPPYLSLDVPIKPPGPDKGPVCFTFDAKWLPYIIAVVKTLTLDGVYDSDQDNAKGEASLLLEQFYQAGLCASTDLSGSEMDDCMGCCIRMRDGVLQVLQCGEWVPVDGWDPSTFRTGQPGQGSPQPKPGDCQEFTGAISPLLSWNLPVPVSSGDTIEVLALQGSWTPIEILPGVGYCPDGNIYFAGACADGTFTTDSRDPMPSAALFGTVCTDGTNYYDVGAAAAVGGSVTITILPGISNRTLTFKCNTYTAIAPAGEVTFIAKVCNNQAATFSHTFNFQTSPGGWVSESVCGGPPGDGVWTPGQGWVASDEVCSGDNERAVAITITFPSTHITGTQLTFDFTDGLHDGHSFDMQVLYNNASVLQFGYAPGSLVTGTNKVISTNVDMPASTSLTLLMRAHTDPAPASGSCTVISLIVSGIGADPF